MFLRKAIKLNTTDVVIMDGHEYHVLENIPKNQLCLKVKLRGFFQGNEFAPVETRTQNFIFYNEDLVQIKFPKK